MLLALFRKELRDMRGQTLAWSLGLGALVILLVAAYPSLSAVYSDMIAQLPEEWISFVAEGAELNTLEGYLRAEIFGSLPLIFAVFAVLVGTATIAGEENKGSLDMLLAQPISRVRLLTTKLANLVFVIGAVIAALLAGFWITAPLMGLEVSGAKVVWAFLLLWPFEVGLAFMALMLSQLFPSRVMSGTLVAALLVVGYVLESLSASVSWFAPGKPVYLTSYLQSGQALTADIQWVYVGGLIAFIAFTALASIWMFTARDLGTGRGVRLKDLMRTQAS